METESEAKKITEAREIKDVLSSIKTLSFKQLENSKSFVMLALNSSSVLPVVSEMFGSAEQCFESLLAGKSKPRGAATIPTLLDKPIELFVDNHIEKMITEYVTRANAGTDGILRNSCGHTAIRNLDVPITVQSEEVKSLTINFRIFIQPTGWQKSTTEKAEEAPVIT